MSAAHFQNYYHPVNHNERVNRLVRHRERLIDAARAERSRLIDLEKDGISLSREDSDKCSKLFFRIRELTADIIDLKSLTLPENN